LTLYTEIRFPNKKLIVTFGSLPYGKQMLIPNSRLMEKFIVAVITALFCSLFCVDTNQNEAAASAKGGGQSGFLNPHEEPAATEWYPNSKPASSWATKGCFTTNGN
jgi:hypothetical protein